MRLPKTAHTDRPWRIHEIAGDFRVEDVWALPTPGGPDDFVWLMHQMADGMRSRISGDSPLSRLFFAVRWKLGALLRWDKSSNGVGKRFPSLRDRLPDDLRDGPRGPDLGPTSSFRSVYQRDDEWVAEMGNKTVHGLMHLAWVPDDSVRGGYRGQMTVLAKPNGRFGALYMLAILPFRYLGVYPALIRSIGREWRENAAERSRTP